MAAARRVSDDTVRYYLFPKLENPAKTKVELEKKAELYTAKLLPAITSYIWQDEQFSLCVVDAQRDGVPPHLEGSTYFGDNVEDEWFIVYLLFELTKEDQDLVIKVEDADGEFLLIEAAEHLPKWVNPETSENRFCAGLLLCIKGELEGSKLYQSLLQRAREHFVRTIFTADGDDERRGRHSASVRVAHLLRSLDVNLEKLREEAEKLGEPDDRLADVINGGSDSFDSDDDLGGPGMDPSHLALDMKSYMELMDRELAGTNVGLSFERQQPAAKPSAREEASADTASPSKAKKAPRATAESFDELDSDDDEEPGGGDGYRPVDINLTALKNILESYSSQEGLPGPAGNLLSAMGISVPRDEDA
ncbi:hypothetical protein V5799_029233 [Amblyomma americanum]|uniref:Uncharacterized protein n=1 Tax=Amblyomma americanum TaxID=6943 RepID=A0AAQ4ERS5_AMBAM